MPTSFDAIVIGTGQAGPSLAARIAASGMKVAVLERGAFGGTCVNTGCIPTKSMVASAYAAHLARRSAEYGVHTGPVTVDLKQVMARKNRILAESRDGIGQWLGAMENCRVYRGHARFESPREVVVGSEILSAEKIFINVGGRPVVPPIPWLDQVSFLNNRTIMELEELPSLLVILGGSYIGLEFGQMFRRFGSQVDILERGPRLISREDEDVSEGIRSILEKEGVGLHTLAGDWKVDKNGGGIRVRFNRAGEEREVTGSHLLVATGRRPNTDDLGLDRAGVQTDKRGYIQVDDQLRTNVPGIWAMGDCNGKGGFTHTSYNDFEIVAANLLDNDPRKVSDRITAYNLYIDPPLGRVGMTEAQARGTGRPLLAAKRPMTKVGRAVEKGEDQGFMKVVVDAETKEILGAAILGVGGDEAIHSILDVMYAKKPYTLIQRAVHIHPTVSELIPTLLGSLKPIG